MNQLILHHYDVSPFSEKVRMVLGLKNIAWKSVVIPDISPKPDLRPLTGGYRHTPVLQIGADVYCDTRLIVNEIERRYPTPPLWSREKEGLNRVIEVWAERDLFWPAAHFVTGINAQTLGPRFHTDRAALRGKSPPSLRSIQKAADRGLSELNVQLPVLNSLLSGHHPYLLGQEPSLADISTYHALWFLKSLPIDCSYILEPYKKIIAWMKRLGTIEHGERQEISAKEALEVARENQPTPVRSSDQPPKNTRVAVYPSSAQTEPVKGMLVIRAHNHIAVKRSDPKVGSVVVHFPQIGYIVKEI